MKNTIEMAREAGFETMLRKGKILGFDRDGDYTEELKAFESLVRADERSVEREACAKLVEENAKGYEERAAQPKDVRDINPEVARIAVLTCRQLTAAIRERSANAGARGNI